MIYDILRYGMCAVRVFWNTTYISQGVAVEKHSVAVGPGGVLNDMRGEKTTRIVMLSMFSDA